MMVVCIVTVGGRERGASCVSLGLVRLDGEAEVLVVLETRCGGRCFEARFGGWMWMGSD
jgi:hypothetical protein